LLRYTALESALAEAELPRLEAYKNYIKVEQDAKDSRPDRVQLIFERAICDGVHPKANATDPSLWLAYVE
jgi:hypothetical protein